MLGAVVAVDRLVRGVGWSSGLHSGRSEVTCEKAPLGLTLAMVPSVEAVLRCAMIRQSDIDGIARAIHIIEQSSVITTNRAARSASRAHADA